MYMMYKIPRMNQVINIYGIESYSWHNDSTSNGVRLSIVMGHNVTIDRTLTKEEFHNFEEMIKYNLGFVTIPKKK